MCRNPFWDEKREDYFKKDGYILVKDKDCKFKSGYIPEHRKVVEKFIQRKLKTSEVVHHINSNRSDNRIENLMIFPSQEAHQSFHNKINKDGWTRYRLKEVEERWIKQLKNQTHMSKKEKVSCF